MTKLRFEDISNHNLASMQHLLFERNGTLPAYIHWKYGPDSPRGDKGVIAFLGKDAVGCFGLVPKTLHTGDREINCGWFADWYVSPAMRGSGLGKELLRMITIKGYPLFFGHPGTSTAITICLKNNWKCVPFQSRRRFILRPFRYYTSEKTSIHQRFYLLLKYFIKSRIMNLIIVRDRNHPLGARFEDNLLNWLMSQPVNPKVTRIFNSWAGDTTSIHYFDDSFASGKTRRRVLRIQGTYRNPLDIKNFLSDSRNANIDFVETFTTDPSMDALLGRAGGMKVEEKPVVWYRSFENFSVDQILIEGIDRENWTYLAGDLQ